MEPNAREKATMSRAEFDALIPSLPQWPRGEFVTVAEMIVQIFNDDGEPEGDVNIPFEDPSRFR